MEVEERRKTWGRLSRTEERHRGGIPGRKTQMKIKQ